MSEREDVLQEFGWYEHEGAYREAVWDMADEIVRLRAEKRNNVACVKWIAAAFCDEFGNPRGDMPQWAHAVTDTLLLGLTPADAVIRALTPRAKAMSEREDVLLTALDEAVEAREGTYFRLDYPTERDYAIKQYAAAREAIRRALTPTPRVVVTDWYVTVDKSGYSYMDHAERNRADVEEEAKLLDDAYPQYAPHRVVRVALVDAATTEAPADGA